MLQQLAELSNNKPLKKCVDLEIGKKYPLLKISRPESKFGNLLLESNEFKMFLPQRYNYIKPTPIREDEKYFFMIDEIIKLKSDLFSCKVAFFDGEKKLN